jgi:hypothetical protein
MSYLTSFRLEERKKEKTMFGMEKTIWEVVGEERK